MSDDRRNDAAMSCAAVILAGGAGRRLGGVDKPGLDVGGMTLLDRALAATQSAASVVVVGPEKPTTRKVRWAREDPPGSGPVAAVAAGMAKLTGMAELNEEPDLVALFAADLIGLQPDTLDRLIQAVEKAVEHDGAALTDDTGHPQWLASVWRFDALRRALPEDPAGKSLRSVLGPLHRSDVAARPGESADVDTPADLAAARGNSGQTPMRG